MDNDEKKRSVDDDIFDDIVVDVEEPELPELEEPEPEPEVLYGPPEDEKDWLIDDIVDVYGPCPEIYLEDITIEEDITIDGGYVELCDIDPSIEICIIEDLICDLEQDKK